MVSTAAVVVAPSLVSMGSKGRVAGDLGVVMASAVAAPWSGPEDLELVAAVLPSGWGSNFCITSRMGEAPSESSLIRRQQR